MSVCGSVKLLVTSSLSLQLAVDVQVPPCFGGLGGQAVFIDTEGTFVTQRVVDMAAAAVHHCSLLAEDDEQRAAMTTFTVETILSNIFLVTSHLLSLTLSPARTALIGSLPHRCVAMTTRSCWRS